MTDDKVVPMWTLALPLKGLHREEIATRVLDYLNEAVMHYRADDLYVMLKQLELAVETGLDILQEHAVKALQDSLAEGEKHTERLGHQVELRTVVRGKDDYGPKVRELISQQKAELKAAQAQAVVEKEVTLAPRETTIAVKLI
jgi:hypothetical protein